MINNNFSCRQIKYSDAALFYYQYEHLGHPGRGVYHWGAYENEKLVAVVSFGTACFAIHRGKLSSIAKRNKIKIIQLTRGGTVPKIHKYLPSWIVSQGLRRIKELYGDCLVVAYSDPKYNEIGTIYQASNFYYLGMTNPKGQSDYIIRGKKISGWKVRKLFGTRELSKLRSIDPKLKRIPLTKKYIYVYPAISNNKKKNIIAELKSISYSYPKRETEGINNMNVTKLIIKRKNILPNQRLQPTWPSAKGQGGGRLR
jgi:hypothetical protein